MNILSALVDIGPHWDLPSYFIYVLIGVVYAYLFRQAVFSRNIGLSVEHRLFLVAATCWLFFFIGFRSADVGSDTRTYISWFQNATVLNIDWLSALTFKSSIEPVYYAFQFLLRQLGDSQIIFTCGEAALISVSLTVFFNRFLSSTEMTLPLVLVSVYFEFSAAIARSAVGMCFILIGLVLSSKGKHLPAIIMSILGMYTHNTLAIFFPMFVMLPICTKFTLMNPRQLVVMVVVLTVIVNCISTIVYEKIILQTRYSYYENSGTSISLLSSWNILLLVFHFVAMLSKMKDGVRTLDYSSRIVILAFIFEIITLPFVFVSGFWRLALYFLPIRCVVWGVVIRDKLFRCKNHHIRFLIVYSFFLAFQFYVLFYLSRESYFAGFSYSFL